MLIFTVDDLEGIKIGENIYLGFHDKFTSAGKVRKKVSIVAPRNIGISRINGEEWHKGTGRIYLKQLPYNK